MLNLSIQEFSTTPCMGEPLETKHSEDLPKNASVQSPCHYLFGKEAREIFNASRFPEAFANECLETLMKINVTFLSRKQNDGFFLLDPASFNNQCHLYAVMAGRIKQGYKKKSNEEKLARTQENRFLHLAFFLSYAFIKDRTVLCRTIEATRKETNFNLDEKQKKHFFDFVKDPGGFMTRSARVSLNEIFERTIKDNFSRAKEDGPLQTELYQLSLENLQLKADGSGENSKLYTLPKLAGVAYLLQEQFTLVIKTKILSSEGLATHFYQNGSAEEDDPVLVFEAVASDDLSMDDFRRTASQCPSYFERNPSSKNRHGDASCRFCDPQVLTKLKPYEERITKATQSIPDMLFALAADFTREYQQSFVHSFFEDQSKYPLLTEIFQRALPNCERLGLSMKKPLAFTVHHVYLDSARHAYTPELRMHFSPEAYLTKRGFL